MTVQYSGEFSPGKNFAKVISNLLPDLFSQKAIRLGFQSSKAMGICNWWTVTCTASRVSRLSGAHLHS